MHEDGTQSYHPKVYKEYRIHQSPCHIVS